MVHESGKWIIFTQTVIAISNLTSARSPGAPCQLTTRNGNLRGNHHVVYTESQLRIDDLRATLFRPWTNKEVHCALCEEAIADFHSPMPPCRQWMLFTIDDVKLDDVETALNGQGNTERRMKLVSRAIFGSK